MQNKQKPHYFAQIFRENNDDFVLIRYVFLILLRDSENPQYFSSKF
jgi:hypothetical protein